MTEATVASSERSTSPQPVGNASSHGRYRDILAFTWSWLSIVVSVTVIVIGAARIALALGRPFLPFGDAAFVELDVRKALHFGVSLGPYSHYGWHHPGPAMFYLFAPLYWLSGESSRALFLDAWLLNGLAALGCVAIVRRRCGEAAGRVAVVMIGVYIGAAAFNQLINPWNPSLVPLPLLLLLVAVAAAATGDRWSLVVAYVAASFVAQTHIGAAPVAVVLAVFATVACVVARRRGIRAAPGQQPDGHSAQPRSRIRSPWTVATWLLGLMWLGPIAQELAHPGNGNLSSIARFFLHPSVAGVPTSHPLGSALAAISDAVTVVPAGNATDLQGHRYRLLGAGALALLGLATAMLARRRSPFVAYLALSTPVGMAIGVIAAMRVVGPYESYLFTWAQVLGVPALIATGILVWSVVSERWRDVGHWRHLRVPAVTIAASLAAMAGLAVWVERVVVRPPTQSFADASDSRAVADRIEQVVGPSGSTTFTLHIVQEQGETGPVILQLAKHGYRFRVVPPMDLYDGDTTAVPTGPTFELESHGPYEYRVLPGVRELQTSTIQVYLAPGPLPDTRVPTGALA